jgi:hypothetical protein
MSDGGDILGDIVQGSLLARAAEPGHGEGGDGHTHERACLNCGTALLGSHCHACGQAAHVHRTLSAFFHDLVHGVFHFEGKIWRTLPLLAWRPGRLTRAYIEGRRASYVSPIALFLFVVFLSFAVFNAIGDPINFNPQSKAEAAKALADANKKLTALEAEKAAAAATGQDLPGIDGQIIGATAARDAIAGMAGEAPAKVDLDTTDSGRISSFEPLNEAWRHAKQNPDLLVYKLQTNAYKYSWLLIPISVPFVWLLFPFTRLTAVISLVVIWGAADWLVPLLLLYAPFHMYRQLRDAYDLSRLAAWWRTWFLAFFAFMALTLFAMALTLLAAGG